MRRRWITTVKQFTWKDIYYTAQKHPKHTLDIAIPNTRNERNLLRTCVFVHGGSWQRGDKSGVFNNGIEQAFVRAGCIGVSINYRLSPEVMHPEHTRDIAAAIHWLHKNIDKYGGDPSNLVLVGHSAGAHLVMQVLSNPLFLNECGLDVGVNTIVKGVVGISGVYNVVRLANAHIYGPLAVNPPFGEHVNKWREVSICSMLIKQGLSSPLYKTPTLLITAQDDFHFEEDVDELEMCLVDGGNKKVERFITPKQNHFTIIRDLTMFPEDLTMLRIQCFLNKLNKY